MPVILSGATSGSTTIQATDAVTATITLPSATDTLVGKTTPSFTTTIGVGNATPSASGAGITFPATQSASTDANTLDDYEEGTWTPTWLGSSTAGSTAYILQTGRYTKVGRLVSLYFDVAISSATGTGSVTIGALPFTSGNQVINAGSVTSYVVAYTGHTLGATFLSATNSFVIYTSLTASNPSQIAMANTANLELAGTITYTI